MAVTQLLVARGRISGTYADGFHVLAADGRPISLTGPGSRDFFDGERDQILRDIERHRASLLSELDALRRAEDAVVTQVTAPAPSNRRRLQRPVGKSR